MAVKMTLQYAGQLRCQLAHGPSGVSIETDAPVDNAGRGESFSPTDLVGAALLSCAVTTMAIKAPQAGLQFTRATGSIEKHMTAAPPRRIARLVMTLELPAATPLADRPGLEAIARSCPVALSLGADVEVETRFVYGS